MIIAVPSNAPGGFEAEMSRHFGHCDAYTLARVTEAGIEEMGVIPNNGHASGGCLQPVLLLARSGVQGIVAGGMGMRPLTGFRQAGITVYIHHNSGSVKDALHAVRNGEVDEFTDQHACQGHGTCGGS